MEFSSIGVIPFEGLCSYIAPLFYLTKSTKEAYFLFRLLYARYFVCLHTIDTKNEQCTIKKVISDF